MVFCIERYRRKLLVYVGDVPDSSKDTEIGCYSIVPPKHRYKLSEVVRSCFSLFQIFFLEDSDQISQLVGIYFKIVDVSSLKVVEENSGSEDYIEWFQNERIFVVNLLPRFFGIFSLNLYEVPDVSVS